MKRKCIFVMLCACMLLGLVACKKEPSEEKTSIIYRYGKVDVTYAEFYVYAKTIEEDYQKTYGEGIWSLELATDDGSKSVRDVTLEDIVSDINRVKVLVAQAEKMDISLSEDEKSEASKQAKEFYDGLTKQDVKETELTRETVTQVIEENMIAKLVYKQMLEDHEFEISDEEARMTTFYDMVFECYEAKKDGSVEEFSDEQKAAQLERANEAISALGQEENVSFDDIAEKYDLQYASSYTMSKLEIVEEYGENVADKILSLSDGEVSPVVQSEYGYHIFKMIQSDDEELTKKNKSDIVTQMEKDYFNETYKGWANKFDSHFSIEDVNMELADHFPFSQDKK